MTRREVTRRIVLFSSLSPAAIGAVGLASICARRDDAVASGTVIGQIGALRIIWPNVENRYGLKYDYRTDLADLKAIARELRELGWVKEDYADRVEKYIDFAFLAKAAGQSPAQLSTW